VSSDGPNLAAQGYAPPGAAPSVQELRLRPEVEAPDDRPSMKPTAVLLLAVLALAAVALGLIELSSRTGSLTGWRRVDLRPVTQPAALGHSFLLYAASEGGLQIIALNARNGSTEWSQAASPSAIAPGQPPELALIDGNVVYLREVSGQFAELVASDPGTGREAWRSAPGKFTSWPQVCPEEPSTVCVTGSLLRAPEQTMALRFDARTGALLPSATISTAGNGRSIGPGLFDPGRRNPEELVAVDGARLVWSKPLASVFTLPGASTDYGWDFDRLSSGGLFVGSPGWPPVVSTPTRVVADLARTMTAGFRISDGSVVWRDFGATYECNILPCPGGREAGYSDAATATSNGPTVGVRERASGMLSGSTENPLSTPSLSPGASVWLEGFSPTNGHTLWSFDAGGSSEPITHNALPELGNSKIVLQNGHNQLLALNLRSGVSSPVSPMAPAWCRSVVSYSEALPYAGTSVTNYIGQFSLYPCIADGHLRAAPDQAPSLVRDIGADADGLTAWSENAGVSAARP